MSVVRSAEAGGGFYFLQRVFIAEIEDVAIGSPAHLSATMEAARGCARAARLAAAGETSVARPSAAGCASNARAR